MKKETENNKDIVNAQRYYIPQFISKNKIREIQKKELIEKEKAAKITHSGAGLNNRLPASLKIKRFLTARNIEHDQNIKRFEAIELLMWEGFVVNDDDSIKREE